MNTHEKHCGLPCISAKEAVLALSGECRLRLGIAGASSALLSACAALDAPARLFNRAYLRE
jgi:hypothetical protein